MANPSAAGLTGTPLYQRLVTDLDLFSKGSYSQNDLDVLDHTLYDTQNFAATTLRPLTSFYTTPVGGAYAGVVKTPTETNMQLQGQIPNSQYFLVKEISFALMAGIVGADVDQNTVVQAYTNIMQNSNFKLILAGRSFDMQIPGTVLFPPVFSHALNSAANGGDVGYHTSSGWMSLKLPIVIEGGAAFSMDMASGSAIAALGTILNTASDVLNTQNAQVQCRMKGTLLRYK